MDLDIGSLIREGLTPHNVVGRKRATRANTGILATDQSS